LLDLARRSLHLWHRFVDTYGNACEFDPKGATVVTRDPQQVQALGEHVAVQRQAGVSCEYLTHGWNRLEPELHSDTKAAGYWPDDAQVQPMLACYQIARQLRQAGVVYRFYQAVTGIEEGASGVAIELGSGEVLEAEFLCLCTGVWTNEVLKPLGISIPVRPRRGHICVLERGDVAIRSKIADFGYNATVERSDGDAMQTAAVIEATRSGTILCGSSREFAGFDCQVNSAVLRRILADCIDLVPALARLRVIRGYAGLRPFSPDGLPIVGPVGSYARMIVATGHEGSGHGLAPVTGELVADMVVEGKTRPVCGLLHPERFDE
jgi:glycine/D-amino acid oxidase-like deaminating enzyme